MAKSGAGTGRQYLLISLYLTSVTYLASKAIKFGEKRRKGYYAVQGHSRSSTRYKSKARMRLPILVINSNWQSRTVAELSQLIVQILDTAFLSHPLGLRDNDMYDVHLGLIGKRSGLPISDWTFLLDVTVEALRAKINRKSATIRSNAVTLTQIFRKRGRPPSRIIFAWI